MPRTLVFGLMLTCCTASHGAGPHDPVAVAADLDKLVGRQLAAKKLPASPRSDDAEFLRRLTLDLHGRPPTPERVIAFLDSRDPDKRRKLIDELLAHKAYGRHFALVWQNLIYPEQNDIRFFGLVGRVGMQAFGSWLTEAFNENRSWDRIARDLLTAEGELTKNQAIVFTLSNMERARVRPDLVAVSSARLFLGVQLQCVECHDHFVNNWKQADFWGLAAFFGQTQFEGVGGQPGAGLIREGPNVRANANVRGSSIVIPATGGNKGAGKVVRARFPGGEEPKLGEAAPLRSVLADWVLAPDNPYFAPAAVNRWWGHLFGRGLVHPVDDMHAGHATAHAELLALLTAEFRAARYDLKHLLRCLCNSEAYQRTSRFVPGNEDDLELFSHMAVKVLTPDVLYDSLLAVLAVKEVRIDAPDTLRVLLPPDEMARLRFVRFFRTRAADATELTQGIPHALSLLNSETLNATAAPIKALATLSPEAAVERLYLTVLARRPTAAEAGRFARFLANRNSDQPMEKYQAILWILLNSSEFMLNR